MHENGQLMGIRITWTWHKIACKLAQRWSENLAKKCV